MNTHTTTITESPAEPGGLDGWAIDCSHCGHVGSYSIKSMTEKSARDHVAYFARKEAR